MEAAGLADGHLSTEKSFQQACISLWFPLCSDCTLAIGFMGEEGSSAGSWGVAD